MSGTFKPKFRYYLDDKGNKIADAFVVPGEKIEGNCEVIIPVRKKKYNESWILVWTSGSERSLKMLAEMNLEASDYRLILYLLDKLGFDNEIKFVANNIANDLNIARATVYRVKKRLLELKILIKAHETGYIRVNPRIACRQSIEAGQKMRKMAPQLRNNFKLIPAPGSIKKKRREDLREEI